MLNIQPWRLRVAAVAVLIVAAGGLAIGSNMGFKMNYPLYPANFGGVNVVGTCSNSPTTFCSTNVVCGGGATVCNPCANCGRNLVSFPSQNPYVGPPCTTPAGVPCTGAFCAAAALPSGFPATTITTLNQNANGTANDTAGFATASCGSTANAQPIIPGRAYQFNIPIAWSPAGVARGAIIVGSHNPNQNVEIRTFTGTPQPSSTNGDTFVSIPYHTTATTAGNLCTQFGLQTAFPADTITVNNAGSATTQFSTGTCGTTANTLNLRLGEGVRIHHRGAVIVIPPAHF